MKRHILGTAIAAALSVSFVSLGDISPAQAASEQSAVDYSKEYDKMIRRLGTELARTKKQLWLFKSELPKAEKKVRTAGYRINATRKSYDELRTKLESSDETAQGEQEKLRKQLDRQRSLLTKYGQKLQELIEKSSDLAHKMKTLSDELKKLSDDVAIERDRFPETDHRQKKVERLVAESEWVLDKVNELKSAWESDFSEPAKETFERTQLEE